MYMYDTCTMPSFRSYIWIVLLHAHVHNRHADSWQFAIVIQIYVDCTAINNQANNIHCLPSGPCIQCVCVCVCVCVGGGGLHPPGYGPVVNHRQHNSGMSVVLEGCITHVFICIELTLNGLHKISNAML